MTKKAYKQKYVKKKNVVKSRARKKTAKQARKKTHKRIEKSGKKKSKKHKAVQTPKRTSKTKVSKKTEYSKKNEVEKKSESQSNWHTGRHIAQNLAEQLAMKEVKSNPLSGAKILPIKMSDKRWLAEDGWQKMQRVIETRNKKVTIHFLYNKRTGKFDDFKFK